MTIQVTESRKQTITDALVQHGIQPTDEAIQSIVVLQKKHSISIREACEMLVKSQGQKHQQKAQGGINQAIEGQLGMAEKMGHLMGEKMMKVSAQVATNHFMNSLVDGSYLSEMEDQFGQLEAAMTQAWDAQFSVISGTENAPLLLESSTQVIE